MTENYAHIIQWVLEIPDGWVPLPKLLTLANVVSRALSAEARDFWDKRPNHQPTAFARVNNIVTEPVPDVLLQHESNEPVIAIGVLARIVGLSVSAVRKYEKEGLLIAHRSSSGHRLFSHEDVKRVQNIQHMIQELGLNIEGIRRMQSLLPCWNILPCSGVTREICPAYKDSTRACWSIRGLDCAPQGNECRTCAVYRFGSLCTQYIKRLIHDPEDLQNADAAMHAILNRLSDRRQEN